MAGINVKRTFVFLYSKLNIGGIETSLMKMIGAYKDLNVRIIWLKSRTDIKTFEPWEEKLRLYDVEIINVKINRNNFIFCEGLEFNSDEEIFATAFDPLDYIRLRIILSRFKNRFNCYYIVPHFCGAFNYIEEYFLLNRWSIKKQLSKYYQNWYARGNLLFFSKRHQEEMFRRYKVPCLGDNEKLIQLPEKYLFFDDTKQSKRALRENFKIITCGRFDFPHKAYMFGLIDTYQKLKVEFPNLSLDIVGYGIHENAIRSYVEHLPPDIKKDISFKGAVDPIDDMYKLYDKAHVNISVAGALVDGAKTGLVSLNCRHYSHSCEVYGWLSKDNGYDLRSDKGENVEKYIRALMSMSDDEYIDKCRLSFGAVKDLPCDPMWLFTQKTEQYEDQEENKFFEKIFWHKVFRTKIYEFFKKIYIVNKFDIAHNGILERFIKH